MKNQLAARAKKPSKPLKSTTPNTGISYSLNHAVRAYSNAQGYFKQEARPDYAPYAHNFEEYER